MTERRPWSREESLLAFRLYCRTPFGQLRHGNPTIIALAQLLGRTPSAVSMKACNFASFDPLLQARGVRGLTNASKLEPQIWEEFSANSTAVAAEAEAAHERLIRGRRLRTGEGTVTTIVREVKLPDGPTEAQRLVTVRRVQRFFRHAVLMAYGKRCALTGLAIPALLNASHIIPWRTDSARRADPRNGLCLNALHDRAFDRGLITFDQEYRVVLSPHLRDQLDGEVSRGLPPRSSVAAHNLEHALRSVEGRRLQAPERFAPDPAALDYHRLCVFHA
ncbi:MAG: HNH endonuclease signature motif containing protein [Phycisphaeraceae bacterium]